MRPNQIPEVTPCGATSEIWLVLYLVGMKLKYSILRPLQFDLYAKLDGHGVINIDATYFGRNCGVIAALDTNTGKPLYMKHISHEHVSVYVDAVHEIEKNGYILDGMVIDGIQSLFKVFANYKIRCAIITCVQLLDARLQKIQNYL